MKIPIFNAINDDDNKKKIHSENLNVNKLNNLNFSKPDLNKFPLLKIISLLPNKISLFETVLVTVNDEAVRLFLEGKIKFTDIHKIIFKIINSKKFTKYKKKSPKNLNKIINLNKFVRLKMKSLSV